MPDFMKYHRSTTAELYAVKNRIRNLVRHWPSDGEWKEAALRTVLRRHLPGSAMVGRGFIVGRQQSSTQIDLLVSRPEKPTLFRDGELFIVTPDVPGAIAEVKTRLRGLNAWYEVIKKLAQHGRLCKTVAKNEPWLGVFSYEGDSSQARHILEAVCRVHQETGIAVNCITCGSDLFVRYWPPGEHESGDNPAIDSPRKYWRAYSLELLSPSYFISNLIDALCKLDRDKTDHAWFAYREGKFAHLHSEIRGEDCEQPKRRRPGTARRG